jgi:hypothetical protein
LFFSGSFFLFSGRLGVCEVWTTPQRHKTPTKEQTHARQNSGRLIREVVKHRMREADGKEVEMEGRRVDRA